MSMIRRLFAATGGNAKTLFALALVPVVCATGAAVDYGHVTRVRAELTSALDRSLVDLGRHPPADAREQYAELREGMENLLDPALEAQWKIESLSEREGHLVAVRRDGSVVIPKIFFDDSGHVVKPLQGLLIVLHDGGYHETVILRWLFTPDPSLTISRDGSTERQANARPVDALHSHQAREVVRRAQAMAY